LWYAVAGDLTPYLATEHGWHHTLCVGLRLHVRWTDPDEPPSVELVAWLLAGVGEPPDAPALMRIIRGHWGIENGVHYRRDVSYGEDRNPARIIGPLTATCRNIAILLGRMHAFPYTTDLAAYVSGHVAEAVTWLTQPCPRPAPTRAGY
jgi:hypothetical protein